jgi:hypothetical protein
MFRIEQKVAGVGRQRDFPDARHNIPPLASRPPFFPYFSFSHRINVPGNKIGSKILNRTNGQKKSDGRIVQTMLKTGLQGLLTQSRCFPDIWNPRGLYCPSNALF